MDGSISFDFPDLKSDRYVMILGLRKSMTAGNLSVQLDGAEIDRLSLYHPNSIHIQAVWTEAFSVDVSGHHRVTLVAHDSTCLFQYLKLENLLGADE